VFQRPNERPKKILHVMVALMNNSLNNSLNKLNKFQLQLKMHHL
jgi:hypothetical protein